MIMRRDALKLVGCGLSAAAGLHSAPSPRFPKGAIIRTVLKDLAPELLAGGATLFHEHMSLAADFMPRWIALARAGRGQPAALARGAPPAAPAQPYFMEDATLMS